MTTQQDPERLAKWYGRRTYACMVICEFVKPAANVHDSKC